MKGYLTLAACVLYVFANAQDSLKTLNDVVITATKFPLKQSATGKVITVITKQDLQESSGKSLPEILNTQAGLVINGANNTLGTNQSVYLRGSSYSNTLILVDGIPMYDPSGDAGQFDLNNFALNTIERIEILKGAQSTLYGSDAVAGVINIITKKSANKPVAFNLDLSAGSYNTWKGAATIKGNAAKQTYAFTYSKIKSDGFSSAYDSTGHAGFDKDGFNQDALQLNYGYKASEKFNVRLYGKYNLNKADIDGGAFADDKDYTYKNRNVITGTTFQYQLPKVLTVVNYYYNWFKRDFVDDSASIGGFSNYQRGMYNGKSHFAEAYVKSSLQKHVDLLTGVDYRKNLTEQVYIYLPDYGFPAKPIGNDSAKSSQVSVYASLFLKDLNGFNTELGGRWNNHNIYGNNFTYSFNPSYLLIKAFKVFANVSSGYRVPSLYQLYSEYGNKDLKPEESSSFEAGTQYLTENLNARIVFFSRRIKNVFTFFTDATTFASRYVNADEQRDHGLELEFKTSINNLADIQANYTYVMGKLESKTDGGKDTSFSNLYKRPAHALNLAIGVAPLKSLYFSTSIRAVSHSFDPQFGASPFRLHGYYTLNLYGAYTFIKSLKLFADLQNITDQKYFDQRGFTTKRFNINAGINVML